MKNLGSKLTYSNVISTLCLFLILGGGTAIAASHLGKNSVGSAQLKKNAVTAAKLKNGAVTGPKIAVGTLGTVPSATTATHAATADSATTATNATNATNALHANSANTATNSTTTDAVRSSKGVLSVGQSATVFQLGSLAITAQCKQIEPGHIGQLFTISSTSGGSVFTSWSDGSSNLGPATPEAERELNSIAWADSAGPYAYDGPADINVSASSTDGSAFSALIGEATEANTNTCWYWLTANVIG